MAMVSVCPNAATWRQLLAGRVSAMEAEALEQHLSMCQTCLNVARQIPTDDTLDKALQQQSTPADLPVPAKVRSLMDLLKKLRPTGVGASQPATGTISMDDSVRPEGVAAGNSPSMDKFAFLAPAEASGELGRLGGYRVLNVLGQGGMGVVFQALDVKLDRLVALKVMLPKVAENAGAKQRFLREAKACASLKHDHIVSIYQVGEDRGCPFIAMEFLTGMPLDRFLAKGRKLTTPQILRIGREVAKGLAAAHEKGMVHRDIKPGNIWLDKESGRSKILDFGLARTDAEDVHLTASGAIVGTPSYMAPEQARSEKVDGRCDLFSLGCVLYRLCAGVVPFKGETTMAVLMALGTETPTSVKDLNVEIPAALSDLIDALLAKDPKDRPQSARDVIKTLQAIQGIAGATQVKTPATTATASALKPAAQKSEPSPIRKSARTTVAPTKDPPPAAGLAQLPPIQSWRFWTLLGAGCLVPMLLLGGWIILRDKNGNKVAELPLPPDGSFEFRTGPDKTDKDGKSGAKPTPPIDKNGQPKIATPKPLPKLPVVERPPLPPGKSVFETFKHADIPDGERKAAAIEADPAHPAPELVAVVGDSRFKHWRAIGGVAVNADGTRFSAFDSGNKEIPTTHCRVWDTQNGHVLSSSIVREWQGGVILNVEGTRLAVSGSYRVTVYDVASGKELYALSHLGGGSWATARYSPKGDWLATTGNEKTFKISEEATGREVRVIRGHLFQIAAFAFSGDGKQVVSAAEGREGVNLVCRELKVWNAHTGDEITSLTGFKGEVKNLVLSPNGQFVVGNSGNSATSSFVWDVKSPDQPRKISTSGKTGTLKISPDGKYLVYGTQATSFPDLTPLYTLKGPAAFSQDSKYILCADDIGLRLCDAATGKAVLEASAPCWSIKRMALSPDGRVLAVGDGGSQLALLDVATGKILAECPGQSKIVQIAFSPDGKSLAGATEASGVCLWETATGALSRTLIKSKTKVLDLDYSPLGQHVAVAMGAGTASAKIIDVQSGADILTFRGHKASTESIAYRADGRLVVGWGKGSSEKATIKIWDAQSGEEQRSIDTEPKFAKVRFSPDGRRLVGTSSNGDTCLWDVETGQLLTLASQRFAAFSPDGALLATPSQDVKNNSLIVWEAATGNVRHKWTMPGPFHAVAFAPDGRHLLTGNGNGTVYVFRLPTASVKSGKN